jgi:hypothetical protein
MWYEVLGWHNTSWCAAYTLMDAEYNALYEYICFDLLGVESIGPNILKCYITCTTPVALPLHCTHYMVASKTRAHRRGIGPTSPDDAGVRTSIEYIVDVHLALIPAPQPQYQRNSAS